MSGVKLGRSEYIVQSVGLGTFEYEGAADDLRATASYIPVLIDTSNLYGTEELVGEAVNERRDQFFVATKVFPDCYRAEDLKRSAKESLARLGCDYIDLLQLHWPIDEIPAEETIGAMEDLVDEGLVRTMGVCNHRVHELENVLAACDRHRIVSNQFAYSLYDRRFADDIVPFCEANDITVIAYSPLGGGGLDFLLERDAGGALTRIAERLEASPAQVALAWTLRRGTAVTIPKSSRPERMIENRDAALLELTEQDRTDLESSLKPRRVRSDLEERSRLIVRRTLYTESGQLNAVGRTVDLGRDWLRALKSRIR